MTSVLLTRPEHLAQTSITKLEKLGYKALNCPLVEIVPVRIKAPISAQNIIVTSQNGVDHGLIHIKNYELPIFAVGEKTAERAKELGFKNIFTGKGNGEDLANQIIEVTKKSSRPGSFVHLCGSEIAFDISQALNQAKLEASIVNVYKTIAHSNFPSAIENALKNNEIETVLFYSVQTATIFEKIINGLGYKKLLEKMTAISLSTRINSYLEGAWHTRKIAATPKESSLFEMLKR
ncbi:uroporphyrinogen-III synthase [Kordiimonas sp. SCSIO 12610]|uniref:uroporphyrinogen-III synthase n=1 Tax=Kordiimonas sp. SCSIO 12610 TaxID=2829597 RepID=UPI00210C7CC6|nr:uroporphyrinogen-III synthase [Kordiimonas sp. SCSIO 12610]UTW55302.1 uroporphyrinogen-III synthase [Kordiimonas sp. SCSIO 12610]